MTEDCCLALRRDEILSVPVGGQESRAQRIDPHALSAPFTTQILGKVQDPGFGDGIGESLRQRWACRSRGNVDDGALALFEHIGAKDLAPEESTRELGVQN